MELDFAPMEGITGAQFRRAHRACFSGVDRYYMPFLSPTRDHVWTPRELRNVAPEVNEGVPVVPQLLTRQAGDFLWAAGELAAMGYEEVNLNLGCPSGTVVAKGKGAGMLADPAALDRSGDGVVQYVMLEGEAGHQDALLRTKYSVLALTEAGVPVEKLANDTADWQRGQASIHMTQWLEEFGDQIEVVFANNDDMALGAIDACLAAELDPLPFVVGVDATPPALEAVEEGTLQGTVLNDAQGQAREMLDLACDLAEGTAPQVEDGHYVWLEYSAVTRKTLDAASAGAGNQSE